MSDYRERKKQLLLRRIETQRHEIGALRREWLQKMEPVDRLWFGIYRFRAPIGIGAGVLLLAALKKRPGKLLLYVRRAAGIWGAVRFIRKVVNPKG